MLKIITSSLFTLALLLASNVAAETPNDGWTNIFKFQTKMAKRGSVSAQYILGEMYEEGRGVAQSNTKAIEWYEKAQRNGHEDAALRITQIKLKLAKPKLKKKAPKRKVKAKKQITIKPKPVRKPKPKKVESKVAKQQKTKPTPAVKKQEPKKATTSPDNLERGAGTHLDDSEDPFE